MAEQALTEDTEQRGIYGNVGIITGKAQVVVQEKVMVEFLYTEIWTKEKNKWMYSGWQGTISKNSPPPPPMN